MFMPLIDPGVPAELGGLVTADFERAFGRSPDAVGHAPGRVNLIGEHTDYNAGLCLPIALSHATWAAAAPRDDGRVSVSSDGTDEVVEIAVADLAPGSVEGWAAYPLGTVWALREAGWDVAGLDLHVTSSVPIGSGLSSSAALECSVGVAVAGLAGRPLTDGVRRELVAAGIRAEAEMAGAPTGGLDQTVVMLARPGEALLLDFQDHSDRPVPLPLGDLRIVVVDTRVSHSLTDGGYGARRADCEQAARELGKASLREIADVDALAHLSGRLLRRARHVVTENDRVRDTVAALESGDWARVGRLLTASHESLRDDFEVSTPELDLVVDVALAHGALGARMTGGGFGGSALALVSDDRVDDLLEAIAERFSERGWDQPQALVAEAGGGAELVRSP